MKTKVVATALNAENAQSQKPHAAMAPRVGEVRPVTRRRLARGHQVYAGCACVSAISSHQRGTIAQDRDYAPLPRRRTVLLTLIATVTVTGPERASARHGRDRYGWTAVFRRDSQNSWCTVRNVDSGELADLRRARDLLEREYAKPLNVPLMARAALMSPSHFSRRFREAYGETPHGYLQTRRVERAMALLRRGDLSVTDVCMAVGFTSLGSFSSTFTRLVGEPPSAYRVRDHSRLTSVPPCIARAWTRPSRNGEARRAVPA